MQRIFVMPDLKFGKVRILSVRGTAGSQHVSLDAVGRTLAMLLRDPHTDFYVREPIERQYLVMPESVASIGPAFAWAHLHLAEKRGANPFHTPTMTPTSHPPDDARMRLILIALAMLGYVGEPQLIRVRWQEYLACSEARLKPEYGRCFPGPVLTSIATHAFQAVANLGCRVAGPGISDPIHGLLNAAWQEFWSNSTGYAQWEQQQVAQFLNSRVISKHA